MEDKKVYRFLVTSKIDRGWIRKESAFAENWTKAYDEVYREHGGSAWEITRLYEY